MAGGLVADDVFESMCRTNSERTMEGYSVSLRDEKGDHS